MSEEFNNENVVYEDLGRIMGLSAYELAVRNGFDGTETEWLESLRGERGYSLEDITAGDSSVSGSQTVTPITATFTDDTEHTFDVYAENGVSITNVRKTDTNGIIDTYTIDYSDGSTTTFTLRNSIDTEPRTYTGLLSGVYIERGAIDTYLHIDSGGDFARNSSETHKRMKILVMAGQMFKLTMKCSTNYVAYVLADSTYKIVDKGVGDFTDKYLYVEKDGYLLINLKFEEPYSIKKVTIFDEVELNQQKLNAALASIPTVEEIIAAIPRAEGRSY